MNELFIPDKMLHEIAEAEADVCRQVRNCEPMNLARELASGYKYPLQLIKRYIGKTKLNNLKILEIGSGNGFFLCYAIKNGLDIVGVEPGKSYGFEGRHLRAIRLLKLNGIKNPNKYLFDASAENLPFENDSFDVVLSVAVLEHVQNIKLAMAESVRVLKPGGLFIADVPNYNSFYEQHYNIFWIPRMGKRIAKIYVQEFFGRNPDFIDGLNFTNPSMFGKYLDSRYTYGKLHLHGRGWTALVFEGYNYCLDGKPVPEDGRFSELRRKAVALLNSSIARYFLRVPLYALAKLLELFGQATMFDVVLRKNLRIEG